MLIYALKSLFDIWKNNIYPNIFLELSPKMFFPSNKTFVRVLLALSNDDQIAHRFLKKFLLWHPSLLFNYLAGLPKLSTMQAWWSTTGSPIDVERRIPSSRVKFHVLLIFMSCNIFSIQLITINVKWEFNSNRSLKEKWLS